MPQALVVNHQIPSGVDNQKALKILSKSIYRELRQSGYEPTQIVAFATEIVALVTSDINATTSPDDSKLD